MIIDMHAHSFPDRIAGRAMAGLIRATRGVLTSIGDGTLTNHLDQMDHDGVDMACLLQIATKPTQFEVLMRTAKAIRDGEFGERAQRKIIPFPSVHPADPDLFAHLDEIAAEGFKGVKFHPYYQGFSVDEPRMRPLYEKIRDLNLMVVVHCGFDIAYPHDRWCNPAKIARLAEDFPGLKLVATHFGGWMDWEESARTLLGRPIWLDASMASPFLPPERVREMALAHPAEYLLFGTDSPWTDQSAEVAFWKSLDLGDGFLRGFFGGNAERLLASAGRPA